MLHCIAVRFLHRGIFYAMFNKLRIALNYAALRYLLLENGLNASLCKDDQLY